MAWNFKSFLFGDSPSETDTRISEFADTGINNLLDSVGKDNKSPSDILSELSTYRDIKQSALDIGNKGLLKDPYMMSNISGLASTLLQAAALPAMMKNAKLQNKSLQFNLDTAKAEQARRNNNISAFNRFSA